MDGVLVVVSSSSLLLLLLVLLSLPLLSLSLLLLSLLSFRFAFRLFRGWGFFFLAMIEAVNGIETGLTYWYERE
jgi:hypothetical protein